MKVLPIYKQIENEIINNIDNNIYLANQKLPSERELAEKYEINRLTVAKAINHLEELGYVYRVRGKGTFVAHRTNKITLGGGTLNVNAGFTATTKNNGILSYSRVIYSGLITQYTTMARRLRISPDEPIFALHRIRYMDDIPVLVEYTYIPATYFPHVEEQDFSILSLYAYMKKYNRISTDFHQKLTIMKCPKKEAKYLNIVSKDDSIFYFEYLGRTNKGEVVEYTRAYYKSEAVQFRFNQYYADF